VQGIPSRPAILKDYGMTSTQPDAITPAERGRMAQKVGFIAVAVFLLVVVLLLPFSIGSVIANVVSPQARQVFSLTPPVSPAFTTTRLNLNVIGLDEWQQLVTVRVSGQHICSGACPFTERVLFVSIPPAHESGQGMPPNQSIDFPNVSQVVTKDIQLPVSGEPVRYPYDVYRLNVAAIQQRVYPDGRVDSLEGSAATGTLFLSLHMEAPRLVISQPTPIDLESLPNEGVLYNWVSAYSMTFARPLYLQVLTLLLVLLVSAAAAYAVFMRPLDQLVINAGALILGVWGIRAILVGTGVPGITAVDLCLILVILFLLVAMTVRALRYLYRVAEM
jgi:hypothetical protein